MYKRQFLGFLGEALKFTAEVALVTAVAAVEVAASPEGQAYIESKNQREREEAIYRKGKRDGERKAKRKRSNLCNVDLRYC